MQDPKTKQVDSWDEEVVDVKPTQVSDWGEDVVDAPVQKKSEVGNESTQPLQQGTEGSAMGSTESAGVDFEAVKGTPTPEGIMLPEVEVVEEKPSAATKIKSSFLQGLKSYEENETDYDLLFSNAPPQRKIELLERRRNEQLPTGEQKFIEQAAGMLGGTVKGMAKSVGAGLAAAPATPIASVIAATGVAMGDGYHQGGTSAFKEAYYQAVNEGKTPEEAIAIAQNVGQTGAIGGAVEGAFGAVPLTKMAGKLIKPTSKLLQKGLEFALDATIDGSVAAGAQVATNVEAQKEGLKRELKSGAKEAFIGEAAFSGVSNAAHPAYKFIAKNTIGRIATDGVSKEDRRDALTIAATQPISATVAATTEAVNQGLITQQRADEIVSDVTNRAKALETMPSNLDLDEQNELAEKIEERQKLEKDLDKSTPATEPFIQAQINTLDKSIAIPLPPKYINTAGKNLSELKDGQLYITRKGDVRMWDAAQEQFLEAPKTTQVKLGTEVELEPTVTETKQEPTKEVVTSIESTREPIVSKKEEKIDTKAEKETNIKEQPKETAPNVQDWSSEQQTIDNHKKLSTEQKEKAKIESTAKALDELQKDTITKSIEGIPLPQLEINGYKRQSSEQYETNDANSISEAYHKAKADGSNPELVKAVEELLGAKTQAKPLQTEVVTEEVMQPTETVATEPAPVPETTEQDFKTLREEEQAANQDEEIRELLIEEEAKIRRASERLAELDALKGANAEDIADNKETAIADHLGRITEESFEMFDDRNNINEAIRKAYFTNKKTKNAYTLDQAAKDISDESGMEITPADVSKFIKKYPEGRGVPRTKNPNTYYGSNSPKMRMAELLSDAEAILGYELDSEGLERFAKESADLADEIAQLEAKPISDADVDALNLEYEEYLKSLTDGQRKRELAKQRIEGEQIVEGAEDANLKAIKDRDAEAREAEEGIVPIVEQVVETIEERIAKAKAALKERNAGKLRSGLDFENLDLYTELAYLYIRKGVKSAADFAKELGEELSDAIKKAWDAANANYKAEAENFDKWKTYAKKQFEAEDGGLEFQDFKARFNKKFNVAADDVALVEIFSEAQSEYNAERGKSVSRKEVDKSFKPERKNVEVDEKTALKDQIRLEAKAAKEGAKSVTEAVKAIVKYVNEMSDRGNLTRADLTKIMNLIPIVKDQKTLDATANKIYDIIDKADSDVIEVSERKALLAQIKLEAKAAKEGFREARKQQQSFADRIKAFLDSAEVKGKLSPTQVKSLINRASNIKTELQLDRFIDYAEKVIDNVNYDAEMNEIRRQQKVAKSRKHTSMQKAVNEFLAINPETIPDNLMPEYQRSLDELSGRVPSYKTFQDIYHQVMSLNTPKDNYSNVKTYNDALDLYNSIAVNKVASIEEYRQLFKDINAFKRKVDALFENGDITEQEHTDLLEQVGKDQKTVEDKYASEIYSLKTDLILEMKNMFSSVSLQNMTEEGKDLLRRLNKLNNNDLRNLSPEEIYNLTSILDNIRETGYVDAFRLNSIIAKANGVVGGKEVGGQIQKAKPFSSLNASVKEISDKLSEAYSSFWEDKLGLGSREAGAYYNNIVSPMERAVSSYREAVQNGYKKINELKKKYGIKQESMDRIGLFASYLREYGLGQDVDTKGQKDSNGDLFGTRDWFKTILEQQKETQTLSKNDIDAIRKAWESLPKTNGKVDVEALEKSYRDGTNQFLAKNEMQFLKEMMAWKDENLTGKQQAANEFRGKGLGRLLYHIKRIRKDGKQKDVTSPIEITEQGNVRIAAGSGKEVQTNEVGAIEHNFEKIFSNNLEETMRDYYMTPMLQQASQVLSNAEKTAGKRNGYVEVMRKNLADAVNNEFAAEETNKISRFFSQSLLKARAAQVLIAPLRTVGELVSSLVSYPMRTREMGSYLELFRKKDVAQKLLNATGSPFKDKANINKHFDVQDGSLKEQGKFDLATGYFAAMPERAGLLPVWMASFDSAFKKKTGVNFDRDAYMNDPAYEKKYQRDIDNAASQADALYGEIAGSPTKAGQRREVRFAPSVSAFGKSFGLGNTVSANSPVGKVVAFMTGYPFREVEGMLKAGSAMNEAVKDADASKADVAAQALPIVGSILGAATYGLFQSLNYELSNFALGDDEEKKKAKDNIETLTSPIGLLKETLAGAVSLLASKYSGMGRQMIKWMGSLAYNMTDDEKDKVAIRSMIRNVTFQDPYEIKFTKNGKINKFMQKEKIAKELTDGIAPLTVFIDNTAKAVESIGGYQYLAEKINKGQLLTEPEKEAVVLLYVTANALNMVGMFFGAGIPVTTLNRLAKKAIKEKEDLDKSNNRGDQRSTTRGSDQRSSKRK